MSIAGSCDEWNTVNFEVVKRLERRMAEKKVGALKLFLWADRKKEVTSGPESGQGFRFNV